jgi:hypothetical protein
MVHLSLWTGKDFCPRKGRLPGAKWLEWYKLHDRKDGVAYTKPVAEVKATLQVSAHACVSQLKTRANTHRSLFAYTLRRCLSRKWASSLSKM